MRFTCRLLAAVCCLVASSASVTRADVVFGNLGSLGTDPLAASTNASVSDTTWVAQGFKVSGSNTVLQSVSLGLYDSNSSPVRVQLFSDSAGSPGGSALATVSGVAGSTTPLLQSFNFSPNVSLTSESSYWIVVSTTETAGLFNWAFNQNGDFPDTQNSSGWTPLSPTTKMTTDSGSSWSNSGVNRPASFSITATVAPVPEPSTYALAAVGLGLAGLVRARRRRIAAA
jgi:hypothetical protein